MPDSRFFWLVDALLYSGSRCITALHSFMLSRGLASSSQEARIVPAHWEPGLLSMHFLVLLLSVKLLLWDWSLDQVLDMG